MIVEHHREPGHQESVDRLIEKPVETSRNVALGSVGHEVHRQPHSVDPQLPQLLQVVGAKTRKRQFPQRGRLKPARQIHPPVKRNSHLGHGRSAQNQTDQQEPGRTKQDYAPHVMACATISRSKGSRVQ